MATPGYRSHEAAWIGGVSAPPPVPPIGGYFSHEAFWLGGCGAVTVVPPQPVTTNVMIGGVPVQDLSYWRKKRIWNDDDEFIARQLHDV